VNNKLFMGKIIIAIMFMCLISCSKSEVILAPRENLDTIVYRARPRPPKDTLQIPIEFDADVEE
jgi:hypothetical protein